MTNGERKNPFSTFNQNVKNDEGISSPKRATDKVSDALSDKAGQGASQKISMERVKAVAKKQGFVSRDAASSRGSSSCTTITYYDAEQDTIERVIKVGKNLDGVSYTRSDIYRAGIKALAALDDSEILVLAAKSRGRVKQ